jgi:hypothetical protein
VFLGADRTALKATVDIRHHPFYIETIRDIGYRFSADLLSER